MPGAGQSIDGPSAARLRQPTLLQRSVESGVRQRARPAARRGPRQSSSGVERYSRRPASTISDATGATGPPRPPVLPLSSRRDRRGGPGNFPHGYGKALVTGQHRTVSIYATDSSMARASSASRPGSGCWDILRQLDGDLHGVRIANLTRHRRTSCRRKHGRAG